MVGMDQKRAKKGKNEKETYLSDIKELIFLKFLKFLNLRRHKCFFLSLMSPKILLKISTHFASGK